MTGSFAGLTQDEWQHVAKVMWKWPRLGVCSAAEAQHLISCANQAACKALARIDARRVETEGLDGAATKAGLAPKSLISQSPPQES